MGLKRAATVAILLAGAGLGLGACSHAASSLGMNKGAPDEFRVVAKAPLVVPPDYSLRPPTPGEPRPQELLPESAARTALASERAGEVRSDGEKLLVARAGAERADPLARYVVDDEFGDLAHKDKSFADKVMFWHKDASGAKPTPAASTAPEIDPTAESRSVGLLTGEKSVVISKDHRGAFIKLPGL